jgi:benzoyl-CoA reductase/2-hydroxyglutaryl-CoA dehydratase subunit BcrC/BadD/HgdB
MNISKVITDENEARKLGYCADEFESIVNRKEKLSESEKKLREALAKTMREREELK